MLWQKLLGANAGAAGIQYVGSTVGFASATNVTVSLSGTLTGGIASSPAPGDLVIVYAGCSSTSNRIVAASGNTSGGYTSIVLLAVSGTNYANIDVSRQFMGATPDTSVTASHNGAAADTISVYISVWRGVDATTPLDVTRTTSTTGSALDIQPPAITPITSGAYIVSGAIGAAGSGAIQSNGVYTSADLSDFRSIGGGSGARTSVVGVGYKEWTSGSFQPDEFGILNITNSASCSAAAVTIALRPA